ncbi:MAG: hypothetical protein WCF57_19105 [Pyrinomonadaceae bacterium]
MHRIHRKTGLRESVRFITSALALVALVCAPVISQAKMRIMESAQGKRPDKVLKTTSVKGSFVKFEVGDYTHVVVKKSDGKETSFWLGTNGEVLMKFIVAHKGEPLLLTYQVVKSYIPEAGGYQTIERLVDARKGRETAAQWWRRIKADPAARQKIEEETQKLLQ